MTDPQPRLIRGLLARTDGAARLVAVRSRPWVSATFAGMRHQIRLAAPPPAAEWLSEQLDAIDFAIPGHIVADISLTACTRVEPLMELEIEALTIEDG
jgi:hypothetical protein